MVQISAAEVKKLRAMTGAGMMDCKKALTECGGDLEAAVDLLRKKGLAAAAKKAGRVAAEGAVLAVSRNGDGVIVEINSETDFVSKNKMFRDFVQRVSELIMESSPADLEALRRLPFDADRTVAEALTQLIASLGENIQIRRFDRVHLDSGAVGAYVHGGGKIGVLVAIEGKVDDALNELARRVAMHVAAANPQFIRREDIPAEVVERERRVLAERAAASGKPAHILDRIVDGQLNKFYSEVCLLEQPFVMDTDLRVSQAIATVQADARVSAMIRYQLGEGIEKEESDFAAEVAAQAHG